MNRFQAWYRVQPQALRALLTINVVVYVLWHLVFIHIDATAELVWRHLALNPSLPGILFEPWQLLTYSFLHLETGFWGLIHIAFNLLWLYWIGKEYEELHGSHRLLSAYVFGALGGAILTVFLHALIPGIGAFGGIVHGASAAVLGVITTVAILYPYKTIALIFIGSVRLIYLVIGYLALNLLFLSGGGMSVSAHLGGALFGFLLAQGESRGMELSGWARIFFRGRSRGRGRSGSRYAHSPSRYGDDKDSMFQRIGGWFSSTSSTERDRPAKIHMLRTGPDEDAEKGKSGDTDVDRILDKISESGYDSLTADEKRILYEASKR